MLAALVGAPVLVVLTLNMSIRPMIVTTGGLLLQHLLIGTARNRAIDLRKACCGNFSYLRRLGQFHTGFTLGPHSASAHNVWGLARTSAAEQDRSTTGISSHAGKRAHPGGHFRQHAYSLWTEIGYVQCFSCELDEALTRASTNLASLIIHLCSFDCLRSCPSPNHRFPAATARRGSRRVVCEVADPIDPLCKPVLPAIHADLAARSTRDHLLTDPMIGSCMIAAPPGVPVFIDTRLGFCGSDFSTETLDALAVQPDWKNFLDRYAINIAVLDRSRRLAQAFAVDSRFSLLYGNDEAVVVRRLP